MNLENITVMTIVIFLVCMVLFAILIMLDHKMKRESGCFKRGIFYYLVQTPYYIIRNEIKNRRIWHKIIGELSRFKYKENYRLCKKYPFLRMRGVNGCFLGYSSTWYDCINTGWQIAFGKDLLKDIANACGNDHKRMKKEVHFYDIKEKYGSLRLDASASLAIQCILDKYEYLSEGYCINCGKPAKYENPGYIYYMCKDCFDAAYAQDVKDGYRDQKDYDEHEKFCRLTLNYKKKDFGHRTISSTIGHQKELEKEIAERTKLGEVWHLKEESGDSATYELDEKATYGITIAEMWRIKE